MIECYLMKTISLYSVAQKTGLLFILYKKDAPVFQLATLCADQFLKLFH